MQQDKFRASRYATSGKYHTIRRLGMLEELDQVDK